MIKVGMGYDNHRFVRGRRLVLGGVEIPSPRGLIGHSDADAVLHAVVDAFLGAAGAGDIGTLFPDTDPRFKGADSLSLLAAARRSAGRNIRVVHADVTVITESPRLGPYKNRMRAKIARALGVAVSAVNVKAKSNEGMGWIGRGEGLAALAVVTVEKGKSRQGPCPGHASLPLS